MKSSAFTHRFGLIPLLAMLMVSAQAQVNQWVFKSHMSISRRDFAAVSGTDNRIYAIGGGSNNLQGPTASCEAFDPSTNTWSSVASMPNGRMNHAAVVTPGGKIFVFGGLVAGPGGNTSTIVYNIATNSWSDCADIPVGMDTPAAALTSDGRIMVEQGPPLGSTTAQVWIYDPSNNTWSKPQTDPPLNLTDRPAALISPLGTDFFIGGTVDFAPKVVVNVYDGGADLWSTVANIPSIQTDACAAYGGDNRVYLIGGSNIPPLSTVVAYNFSKNTWETVAALNLARTEAAAALGSDGNVYVMGGTLTDGETTDSLECFTPPILRAIGYPLSATEGAQFSGAVVTFTDNPADTVSNFSATIDWGDGSQTTGNIVNTGSGAFDVRGAHTYAEEGTYTTTVALNDADGESQSVVGTFTVGDALLSGSAASPTAYRAVAFSGKVAKFSDANAGAPLSDFSATINWGDGSTSTGSIVIDPSGGFDVNGGHTYASTGSFSLSVKVSDVGGSTVSVGGTVTVAEPPPVVNAGSISTSEGALFNGQVATFTDPDPNLLAGDFSATINWGDVSTSSGSIVSNGAGGFTVSGNHVYLEEGNLPITVTVAVGGSSGSSSNVAAVADGVLIATGYSLIEKGTTFSDTVATFTDADPNGTATDYTAGIVWGDGKSSNGTIVAFGSGWKVVGSHSYLKRGKYVVTIHIKDVGGATATATTNINVGPVK